MHILPIITMENMSLTLFAKIKLSRKILYLQQIINRGSYMSAHVLLNLSNESGKSDKMPALSSILSLFHNKLNKFNSTGAGMLELFFITFLA